LPNVEDKKYSSNKSDEFTGPSVEHRAPKPSSLPSSVQFLHFLFVQSLYQFYLKEEKGSQPVQQNKKFRSQIKSINQQINKVIRS
jgi:hypothetical protein